MSYENNANSIKTLTGKITLLDFIDEADKPDLDKKLKNLTKMKENPPRKGNMGFPKGSRSDLQKWDISKIPKELDFFKEISIKVISYRFLPSRYFLQIEGIFSKHVLENLEMFEKEQSHQKIDEVQRSFWDFWRTQSIGLCSRKNSQFNNFGTGIINFSFKIHNRSEIIPEKISNDKLGDFLRNKSIIGKYGANTGGPISIIENFENKVSIVAQGGALLDFKGLNFSWIGKFTFVTEEKLISDFGDWPFPSDDLPVLLSFHLLCSFRIEQIELWKQKVSGFSKDLDKFQEDIEKFGPKKIKTPPLFDKNRFINEFRNILYENRTIKSFVGSLQDNKKRPFGKEIPISGNMLVALENDGFLFHFYKIISDDNLTIKDEYAILNNQFDILTSHLGQVITIINTKSNVELSDSNKKTQVVNMIFSGILVGSAIVMVVFAGVQLNLTQQMAIDGQTSTKLLEELQKSNELMLASLYSDYELELEYEFFPFKRPGERGGTYYDLRVENYGDYNAEVKSTWFLNPDLCNEDGTNYYINRTESIQKNQSRTDIIERNDAERYILAVPELYANYTNLKPFKLELWVEGTPLNPDNEPISFFTKKKISRILYSYDPGFGNWTPELSWKGVNCDYDSGGIGNSLILDTTNDEHFKKR